MKYAYETLSKAQANANYYANYDTVLSSPTDTNYWQLHTNPFRNYMFSMDGEFRLSDTLRLSVVPYFQYGGGGGGGGTTFTESTLASNFNRYRYVDQDINYDGKIGGPALVYDLSQSYTWRPGVIAKFIQEFGQNDTLAYGIWLDRPRQEQNEPFAVAYNGVPSDIWFHTSDNLLRYQNGQIQYLYNEYTESDLRRFFATNTWTPTDKWTVTFGAAYTWEQRKGYDFEFPGATAGPVYDQQFGGTEKDSYHKVTPTAGVKYQINDANQIYLGAGRTFRTPVNGAVLENGAAADLSVTDPYPGHEYTNVDKPETSTTADLGWRFYSERVSASLDAYAANFHNKQVSGFDENSDLTVYTELPNVHMRGFNGETSVKLNDLFTLYGSYTYTISRQQDNVNAGNDGIYFTKGKTLTNTPLNAAYTSLNYHQGPVWASLNAKYRGAVWGDWSNTQQVGGYTTFNFNAGYDFSEFSSWLKKPYIKLNLFNLTNHHAFTWASSSPFLASTSDASGNNKLGQYYSPATYSILEERTWMVTIGASFD
jgi:iron complex outermembrane receptor protein